MTDLIVHPVSSQAIDRFVGQGFHAGLITGPAGIGKVTIARFIGSRFVHCDPADLSGYPYLRTIQPVDGKAIPIDSIRELHRFMTLKIPGAMSDSVARLAIIEDAQLLTVEAQNALLKTLEEPPDSTVLLLTATSPDALLPTIQSRVQSIHITTPAIDDVKAHFTGQFDASAVDRAILISGGLPGLTDALLRGNTDHPLYQATERARELLQASAYDRLALVDGLSKQKQLCQDVLYILGQMSRMALLRSQSANSPSSERWRSILRTAYEASELLRSNAQSKLVLTDLMLTM